MNESEIQQTLGLHRNQVWWLPIKM